MAMPLATPYAFPLTPPSQSRRLAAEDLTIAESAAHYPKQGVKHLFIVCGPSGSGKTSVAEHLSRALALPYLEGDAFHTTESVAKMADGHALTDSDRWDWLTLLRKQSIQALRTSSAVVVACSALKRKYRDVLRVASNFDSSIRIRFIFLHLDAELLKDRVRLRKDHYMKDNMVATQIECLEMPDSDELDVTTVNAAKSSEEVQQSTMAIVNLVLISHGTP